MENYVIMALLSTTTMQTAPNAPLDPHDSAYEQTHTYQVESTEIEFQGE